MGQVQRSRLASSASARMHETFHGRPFPEPLSAHMVLCRLQATIGPEVLSGSGFLGAARGLDAFPISEYIQESTGQMANNDNREASDAVKVAVPAWALFVLD